MTAINWEGMFRSFMSFFSFFLLFFVCLPFTFFLLYSCDEFLKVMTFFHFETWEQATGRKNILFFCQSVGFNLI